MWILSNFLLTVFAFTLFIHILNKQQTTAAISNRKSAKSTAEKNQYVIVAFDVLERIINNLINFVRKACILRLCMCVERVW